MPYASVFPISQIFTSPLAVPMTFNGTSYKCVYEKQDISDELNGENYQITAEIPYSTAALIADGDTVTINAINYKVSYRNDTPIGTVILYLSLADMSVADPTLGTELLGASVVNFTSADWVVYNGATKAANLATLPAEVDLNSSYIVYESYIPLEEGATYCMQVVVSVLERGTLRISEQDNSNFQFWIKTPGVHNLYFDVNYGTARHIQYLTDDFGQPIVDDNGDRIYYYTTYIKLSALNNIQNTVVSSISLKKVL